MNSKDEAASGPSSSFQGPNAGSVPFDAALLEEAVQSLEAISGLMEKMQQIVSQGGTSDAAMLEKLKKAASPGAELKILNAMLELAAMLKTGDIPAGAAPGESRTNSSSNGSGRFRNLI
jgi:hypothetical protein